VTTSLLLGCIPGVFLGAQVSARAQGGLVRRALAFVLLASSLKLLYASNLQLILGVGGALVLGPLVWAWLRTRYGLPALGRAERGVAPRDPVADPAPAST
jgi:hypothetical protein